MKCSLIIPAHDHQDLLNASLSTIACQRDELLEVIVVDDGSDPSLHLPDWVTPVRINRPHANRGSSAAKNLGAKYASGDWLCFADADILHLPDAFRSLKDCAREWTNDGVDAILLNVWRVSLAKGYPNRDVDHILTVCRTADLLQDEAMETAGCYYEQNCGMLPTAAFRALDGYDESTFKSWGLNNQDMALRVIASGGRVSSAIPRATVPDTRLYCFHMWHEAERDEMARATEFISKWGEPFHQSLVDKVQAITNAKQCQAV